MARIGRELQLTIQTALREAMSRRHAYVTVEHLLYAVVHDDRGSEILRNCGVDLAELKKGLQRFFTEDIEIETDGTPQEGRQTLAFHRVVQHTIQHVEAAEKEEADIGDLVAAIFQEPDSHAVELLRSQGASRLDVLRYISHGISKQADGAANGMDGDPMRSGMGGGELDGDEEGMGDPLEAFATNLSELAVAGKLDPLVGRQAELERTLHILARRRKNNPIFVGETGVGKTSIAEGLAQRIAAGQVPHDLEGAEIFALDLGALLAGTRFRGDFEARFKALIAAVRQRRTPILFIDEIHSILGAGQAQGGAVDASSMLKPILATGELRCMGSTTYAEYRHFERDRALSRRFQRVDIREPSEDEAVKILEGLAERYEEHHGVRYTKPSLRQAVMLSSRHLSDRFLPDKAIDVMDEAGAAMRLRRGRQRKTVGVSDMEETVARIAGVPLQRVSASDRTRLERLETDLLGAIYGQDEAVRTLVRAVKRARAGLGRDDRPTGCFLFTGPTGVGKTELSKQLAEKLGVPFLRFDMSEYQEKHTVSRLIGAPPGYVGFDQGGQLVEAVRKQPYAVLLLDEIEKAHRDIFDVLLQVMDHATLTDNMGRAGDFRHVTLIMTSNVGAREMAARAIGFGSGTKGAGESKRAMERLFSPEFRNRLDEVVQFAPLSPEVMGHVVDKFVREVQARLSDKGVTLSLTDAARELLGRKGFDPDFGARPMGRVIQSQLEDPIAEDILFGRLQRGGHVAVDARDDVLVFDLRE